MYEFWSSYFDLRVRVCCVFPPLTFVSLHAVALSMCKSKSKVSLAAMDDFPVSLFYSRAPPVSYRSYQKLSFPTDAMVSCNLPSFLATNLCPRYNSCQLPWVSFAKFVATLTNKVSLPIPSRPLSH